MGKKIADVPYMIKMWDKKQNTDDPSAISASSDKKVHWRCPDCGYSWTSSAKARYKSSGKCPCHESNKVILKGVNDALTIVKGLSDLLDDSNDLKLLGTQGLDSSMKVNWKCPDCGRRWSASLKSQVRKNDHGGYTVSGCPHYNTVKRKPEEVLFVKDIEKIYRFWDDSNPMNPAEIKSNSTAMAHFICKNCGYEWTSEIRAQGRTLGKCKCCELLLVTKKGYSDVFTLVPESKRFFNFEKNKDIDIYSIPLRNTDILIDWKCPDCGFEWRSPLSSRINGQKGNYSFTGCQQCYLHDVSRITPASSVAKLVKHWDFTQNADTDINLTSAYSSESVHWHCKRCGYEWIQSIKGYNQSNTDCPFCADSRSAIYKGKNDVLTICPELTSIYDFEYNQKKGINIYSLGPNSKTIVHFKCKKCGHEWDSAITNRVKKKNGQYTFVDCPICSNKLFRSVPYSEEFPVLAQMYRQDLNNISLDSVHSKEAVVNTKYKWTCLACGETFEATLSSMTMSYKHSTKGCPYCSRSKLRNGESFAEVHPELLDEYSPDNKTDPYKEFPNSKKNVKWICRQCGYTWNTTFTQRHNGMGKCPKCYVAGRNLSDESFAAVYPEYIDIWAEDNEHTPYNTLYTSNLWIHWKCRVCHGEYGAIIYDMVHGNADCPYCKGTKVLPGFNSLEALHPNIASLWSDSNLIDPDHVLSDITTSYKWICNTCHGEYTATIRDVVNGTADCPYCKGTKVLPGFNSLEALHPNIASLWSDSNLIDPDHVLSDIATSYKWICNTCHGEYTATIRDVVNGTADCPYCMGTKVLPGFNSFAANHPELMNELDPIANYLLPVSPDEVSDSSTYRFWWICKKDPSHKYPMAPKNRLMFEKRHREPCLYCRGLRRKLQHFIDYHPK